MCNKKGRRLFLYDFEESALESRLTAEADSGDLLFSAVPAVRHCIGCFGCWIKTPGKCVIQDRGNVLPAYLSQCSELVIISPITYGGYSQPVKAALDRSIGYLLPYFRIVDGEMHHQIRYHKALKLSVYFYGDCDEQEQDIAKRFVKGNAINLGADDYAVSFYPTPASLHIAGSNGEGGASL